MSEVIANRYEEIATLGHGGMGEVFLANDLLLRRRVAIKRILREHGTATESVATDRLFREARAAAAIHHPNVVAVHDLLVGDHQTLIVMEYLEARSMAEMIRSAKRLDPTTVARIGSQIAAALSAAHRVDITHRDVKPSNILVTSEGIAKLADFGIARTNQDVHLTSTGMLIGSLAYLAPEVARGETADAASDVYSLGATLFTAVEGHAPFLDGAEDSSSVRLLVRLVTEAAPPAVHGGAIAGAIASMLRQEPSSRPTASEIQRILSVAALESAVGDDPHNASAYDAETAAHPDDQLTRLRSRTSPEADSTPIIESSAEGPTVLRETLNLRTGRQANWSQDPLPSKDAPPLAAASAGAATDDPGSTVLAATRVGGRESAEVPASKSTGRRRILPVGIAAATIALVAAGTAMFQSAPGTPQAAEARPVAAVASVTPSVSPPKASAQTPARYTKLRVTKKLEVGGQPGPMIAEPSLAQLHVVDWRTNAVYVVSTKSQKILNKITVGKAPGEIALDEARHRAYVTNYTRTVSVIDTQKRKVIHTITVGSLPQGVAVDSKRKRVYVTNSNSNTVSVLSTETHKVISTIKTSTWPAVVAVDPADGMIYVGADRGILRINPKTRAKTGTIKLRAGFDPRAMTYDAEARRLYVGDFNGPMLVVDTEQFEVVKRLKTEVEGIHPLVDPGANQVYVASYGGGHLEVFDRTTYEPITSLRVAGYTTGLALDSRTNQLFTSDWDEGRVRFITRE